MKHVLLFLTPLAVLSLACWASGGVAASSPTPESVSTQMAVTAFPSNTQIAQNRYRDFIPPSLSDVTYCTVDGIELKMDVFSPTDLSVSAPAVIYVHGGGWSQGDKRSGAGSKEVPALSEDGFVVFAVNYRLAPEHKFPAMIEDVKCAVRSIRAHAAEYNIDPNRIGAFGGSAGGHLVNLLGTTDQSAGFDVGEYLDQSSRVQAVVDMFGPADLTVDFSGGYGNLRDSVFGNFDAALASPVTYITADDPPFLILQGDQDAVVPPSQSQELYDRLSMAGISAELVVVQNAGHGFSPINNAQINPSREQLSQMIVEFFSQQLK